MLSEEIMRKKKEEKEAKKLEEAKKSILVEKNSPDKLFSAMFE
jgi:hypothetical protein